MPPILNAAAALTLCLFCAQAFAQSQQADAALCGRGQGVEAFRACLRQANHGHRGAQFNVGLMYSNGEGTARDDAQALFWFRKSAEQGFPQAQDMLCGKDNGELGLQSCTRQAQAGNRYAQFNLALMYRKGAGVSKDPAQAAHWYRKAADQGFDLAQLALGGMYEKGEGVPQDLSLALYWYWHANDRTRQSVLSAKYDEDSKVTNAAPDRRVPVDLGAGKESLLDSVALVWPSASNPRSWGSGFLISKCHVMTSHHVVFNHKKDEEMKIGKQVVIGLGQTNSPPWKSEITYGTVVGFDPKVRNVTNTGRVEYSSGRDWAIVTLNKDKFGKYPGEKLKPFCLGAIDKAPKFIEAKKMTIRSIGHPDDKYLSTGKLQLWQDPQCKVVTALGPTWFTSCQVRDGMSGGPIATLESSSDSGEECWKPVGIISAKMVQTDGLAAEKETDLELSNKFSPLEKYNRKVIDSVIEASPCD